MGTTASPCCGRPLFLLFHSSSSSSSNQNQTTTLPFHFSSSTTSSSSAAYYSPLLRICGRRHRTSFRPLSPTPTWRCECTKRDQNMSEYLRNADENRLQMFGEDEDVTTRIPIPTQAQSVVEGSGSVMVSDYNPVPDVDYLQELLAIQQQGPRTIGFFGTRNMGFMHQQLVEILSYAMVITKNHIFTSGASGTNAAVIRGALRAEKPELLTVILPQSLEKQPPESQELLSKVKNVIEKPYNNHLPLIEASRFSRRRF